MRSSRLQLIKFEKLNTTLEVSSTEPVEFSKGSLIVDLEVKLHMCRIECTNYVTVFSL